MTFQRCQPILSAKVSRLDSPNACGPSLAQMPAALHVAPPQRGALHTHCGGVSSLYFRQTEGGGGGGGGGGDPLLIHSEESSTLG